MTTLYRFFDRSGTLIYVGISDNWPTRMKQHSRTQDWFDEIAQITFETWPDRESAEEAERQAVINEGPTYNKHYHQPVVGGDGHTLRWRCSSCNETITTKHTGWVCVRSTRQPSIWHTLHEDCTDFEPSFVIPTSRLRTVYDLVDWTCHLSSQPWFEVSDWQKVITPHRSNYLNSRRRQAS